MALHSVNLKTLHNRERKFYSEIIIFQIAAQHIWTSQSVSIRTSANNSIQSWQLAVQSNKGGWRGVKLKAFSSIWELENLISLTRTSLVHISPGSRQMSTPIGPKLPHRKVANNSKLGSTFSRDPTCHPWKFGTANWTFTANLWRGWNICPWDWCCLYCPFQGPNFPRTFTVNVPRTISPTPWMFWLFLHALIWASFLLENNFLQIPQWLWLIFYS